MLLSSCAPVVNSRVHLRAEQAEDEPRRFRQQHDQDRAEHGAERRAEPADDQDRQRLDREQERKALDADKGEIDAIQRAGEAGDEGGGDEGEQLVGVQVDAHDAGRGVVVADRDKGAADAAAPDVERGQQRQDGEAKAEIGEGGVAVEADAEDLRPLHRNAAGAIGEPPRLQDHGVDDEGERQRGDGEVKPLQPQRRRADDQAGQCRHHARAEEADQRVHLIFGNQHRIGVGAGDEEADMAERDQAGIAGQDVEAERADHRDQDDHQERQRVGVQHEGRDDQAGDQHRRPQPYRRRIDQRDQFAVGLLEIAGAHP